MPSGKCALAELELAPIEQRRVVGTMCGHLGLLALKMSDVTDSLQNSQILDEPWMLSTSLS